MSTTNGPCKNGTQQPALLAVCLGTRASDSQPPPNKYSPGGVARPTRARARQFRGYAVGTCAHTGAADGGALSCTLKRSTKRAKLCEASIRNLHERQATAYPHSRGLLVHPCYATGFSHSVFDAEVSDGTLSVAAIRRLNFHWLRTRVCVGLTLGLTSRATAPHRC